MNPGDRNASKTTAGTAQTAVAAMAVGAAALIPSVVTPPDRSSLLEAGGPAATAIGTARDAYFGLDVFSLPAPTSSTAYALRPAEVETNSSAAEVQHGSVTHRDVGADGAKWSRAQLAGRLPVFALHGRES